jgi:acetyl-CoA carboxylase biotin carboxylase subunit
VITRLLVANRGEIALRIIRACREMGIETVAVYSEADAGALHVRAADRAIGIGAAPARDSYLSIARVIDAARSARADAIHPGYGFLSENPAFAHACAAAGIVFVGPPAAVIERMGSKIDARRLAIDAGVPVVPGETAADQTDAGVLQAVQRVGVPALIKASAGGGGKGMRRVGPDDDVPAAIQAARREAMAAFGDGTLYVERLIQAPHHVEVQVFADNHGHTIHLFERECSVQRRHQKVIEESPSPLLTDILRRRISAAAVAVAQAAGYRNAGTVEFLVEASRADADAPFYFLEMNTRLQVEHPVTEEITGLDLVRAQLIVAAGQPLPWAQHDLSQRGHAIEARVYAEDPSNGFIPQAGRLAEYIEPRAPGVRVDSGVAAGSEIPVHYDPMIAKVIATAESRSLAIARLSAALKAFAVRGVRTNLQFLIRVLALQEFHDGRLDTSFLDREAARLVEHEAESRIESTTPAAGHAGASEDRRESRREWDPWTGGAAAAPTSTRRTTVHRPRRSTGSHQALSAPMPATVIKVNVKEGDKVRKGDVVVLLEAMKMELPVRAPADAVVRAVRCRDGELVDADAILVELA